MARKEMQELYRRLSQSEFEIMPPGVHKLRDVYARVKSTYPHLCNNVDEIEWNHTVREALDVLTTHEKKSDRVFHAGKGLWEFRKSRQKQNVRIVTEDDTRVPEIEEHLNTESDADYAIENAKREIQVRQKQSVFRKKVLSNFRGRCCISGISEQDLLIASHIIPWQERRDTRLDPGNGLCLFALYDKLFDLGYMSFDDDLKTIVTSQKQNLSIQLQEILKSIEGKAIARTQYYPINKEFLRYHRKSIFKK